MYKERERPHKQARDLTRAGLRNGRETQLQLQRSDRNLIFGGTQSDRLSVGRMVTSMFRTQCTAFYLPGHTHTESNVIRKEQSPMDASEIFRVSVGSAAHLS